LTLEVKEKKKDKERERERERESNKIKKAHLFFFSTNEAAFRSLIFVHD